MAVSACFSTDIVDYFPSLRHKYGNTTLSKWRMMKTESVGSHLVYFEWRWVFLLPPLASLFMENIICCNMLQCLWPVTADLRVNGRRPDMADLRAKGLRAHSNQKRPIEVCLNGSFDT